MTSADGTSRDLVDRLAATIRWRPTRVPTLSAVVLYPGEAMSRIDPGLIIDIVSGAAGIGGLLLAGLANKRAKEANRLTEKANDVAAKSLTEAQKANRVAQEGNRIAGDANTVAERALAATTDHIQYRWKIEIEGEPPAITVVNDSAHPAMHVTISVDNGHEVIATGSADTVPGLSKLPLGLEGALQKHIERSRKHQTVVVSDGFVGIRSNYHFDLRFTITAETDSGVPHSDVIQQRFSISQGKIKTVRRRG